MIAVIDYGMGNLRSVQKALEKVGAKAVITQNAQEVRDAEKVVLPGVGAMKPAMEKLQSLGLINPITKAVHAGKPFLGICLGLQLLFEESEEGGNVKGLGLLAGGVKRFTHLKVPHMGWNQINIQQPQCPLFAGIDNFSFMYFCHSYFVSPQNAACRATTTDYGIEFTSSVCQDNLLGVQFHPEKSQELGLKFLDNFQKIGQHSIY